MLIALILLVLLASILWIQKMFVTLILLVLLAGILWFGFIPFLLLVISLLVLILVLLSVTLIINLIFTTQIIFDGPSILIISLMISLIILSYKFKLKTVKNIVTGRSKKK
jgi:hypothetical protein